MEIRYLYCPKCNAVVGVHRHPDYSATDLRRLQSQTAKMICPGEGQHAEAFHTERRVCFGFVKRKTTHYPETGTSTFEDEYAGPKKKGFLIFVLLLNPDHCIRVNGRWCSWNFEFGLEREGEEIRSLW